MEESATPQQFAVLRLEATEPPFSSELNDEKRKGAFSCAGCHLDLFSSSTKFDSGTGWPSFWTPLENAVGTTSDESLGMERIAVHCRRCGGHLGHVFDDGPKPTGLRTASTDSHSCSSLPRPDPPEFFARTLIDWKSHRGLEWKGQSFAFGDLDDRAARMARTLADRGLSAGDRLAVYLPNRIEVVDLFLACTRLGIIVVPINVLYREREVSHILRDAEPKAVVSIAVPPGAASTPVWAVEELADAAARSEASGVELRPLEDATPAALVYTSGTTGAAKGAVLTHGNFAANGRNLIDAWRITSSDRMLLALPLFHAHGLGNGIHCWLGSGLTLRLLDRFEYPAIVGEFLEFLPTLFFGVPAMYVRLLDTPAGTARRLAERVRLFVSGSAPLPAQVLETFRDRFGHTILERYGMTETLMTLSNPYDGERRPGAVGVPLPGVRIRVLDDEGSDVHDGVTGELYVASDTICAGYWRQPDATAAAFADGYFRTGDLAVRAPDGYITLQGRRHDLIISGGFNIYPREIEDVLLERAEILDAAVVGAPDRVRGEVPVAFVVLREGSTLDRAAIEQHCREKLASFKIPRAITQLAALPRTALGKVQKHLLTKEK